MSLPRGGVASLQHMEHSVWAGWVRCITGGTSCLALQGDTHMPKLAKYLAAEG